MRILYGVQATGQGHISRARALAGALATHNVEVTWLFSGRDKAQLFDMTPFGDFLHRRGLSFITEAGRLRYRKTLTSNNLPEFWRDVSALDLSAYDLIVSDYEPVVAWAGKRQARDVIGIGHQYAFGPKTPVAGASVLQRNVMQRFAPVARPVGLHWAPFNDNVLPPILDLPPLGQLPSGDHFLVYLPFEDQAAVTDWLTTFADHRFVQYANGLNNDTHANVQRRNASIDGFKRDLASAKGVICNSGFELISECLQWHKPVLTRPLAGQMEQLSNAAALASLGYATVMHSLDSEHTAHWLAKPRQPPNIHFTDVAERLASWLVSGACEPVDTLCDELWNT